MSANANLTDQASNRDGSNSPKEVLAEKLEAIRGELKRVIRYAGRHGVNQNLSDAWHSVTTALIELDRREGQ